VRPVILDTFVRKSGQRHLLVSFASLAFRAPDVTLAFVRTLAVNGPTESVVFCGWGRGWSNLWRDEGADRWSSFIRKKFGINPKSPLVSYVTPKGFKSPKSSEATCLSSSVSALPSDAVSMSVVGEKTDDPSLHAQVSF
jgi:hypothetical protein